MPRRTWGQVYQRPDSPRWYIRYPSGRKTPRGRTAYVVRAVGTEEEAESILAALHRKRLLGAEPAAEDATLTLPHIITAHIEAVDRPESTVTAYRQTLALVASSKLGRVPARDVAPSDLEALIRGFAPATQRRHLAVIGGAYERAIRDELLAVNPARRAKAARKKSRAKEILRAAEIDRLRQVCEGAMRAFLEIGLHTGARSGEIVALRWRDIDWGARTVTIRRSKTGNASTMRLHRDVARVLGGMRGGPDELVAPVNRPWHAFRAALRRAEVSRPGVSPHSLRHTFATRWVANGGNLRRLQRILGHSSIATTERYVRDLPDLADEEIDGIEYGARRTGA